MCIGLMHLTDMWFFKEEKQQVILFPDRECIYNPKVPFFVSGPAVKWPYREVCSFVLRVE